MKLIVSAFLFFMMGMAHAASFDCKKAVTIVEDIICSDELISKLDERMAGYYKIATEKNNEIIKIEQGYWLNSVRNKCERDYCVKSAYLNRISELYRDIVRQSSRPFDFDKYIGSYDKPGETSCFIDGPEGKTVQSVCNISNGLTIKKNVEKNEYYVSFGIVGANFHECQMDNGVAHAIDNRLVHKYHPFDNSLKEMTNTECEVIFEFIEDDIILHNIVDKESCKTRHFCGQRAGFDGFKFSLSDKKAR